MLFQNKINLRYCASGWFYYRNVLLTFVELIQYLFLSVYCNFHFARRYAVISTPIWSETLSVCLSVALSLSLSLSLSHTHTHTHTHIYTHTATNRSAKCFDKRMQRAYCMRPTTNFLSYSEAFRDNLRKGTFRIQF